MKRALLAPIALLVVLPHAARAQDGFDAHALQIAALDGDPRDPLLVQRPGRFRGGEWFAGGVFEFAQGLLVRTTMFGGDRFERTPWLTDLFALNVSAGVAVHERVRFDVALPLVFASHGVDGPNGVDVGDLRASTMIALLRPKAGDLGLGLGIEGHLDLPTGASREFLGQRTVAGGASVAASYALDRFTVTANAGAQVNPAVDVENVHGSDAFIAGLGFGVLADSATGVTLEARLSAPFVKAGKVGTETPAELVLTARHRWTQGAYLLGGASMGVSSGVGAGAWRVFLGAGFGRVKADGPGDQDKDGFLDPHDACPVDAEVVNGWKDDDGCPDALAALDVSATWKGAPLAGAALTITPTSGGEARAALSAVAPTRLADLTPTTTWRADAAVGCRSGSAEAGALTEGVVTPLPVALTRAHEGRVILRVLDAQHDPVGGVGAEWKGADVGCVDQPTFPVDASGSGAEQVGAGTHALFVTAPGAGLIQRDVIVPEAGEVVVEIVLAPTQVEVTHDEVVTLEEIHFEFNSDVIEAVSFPLLDEVAATMRRFDLTVEVAGHTDAIGSGAYNVELSGRRAASVVRYLIEKGVKADRLVSHGYGEVDPVASNATDSGRARNRRVVFVILKRP